MTFDELKEKAHALPLQPGVYIMQNAKNEVIYVGKAKALKNRVSQYFANLASHTEKTRAMVSQIDHFDVIVADSEFEALVLECSLIKRHQPHYNILLKDDKGYPYIRLTVNEDYPRFSIATRPAEDGARYFGPFGSRGATQNIIEAIQAAYKLPACGKKFPRDIGKERPCLNFHMDKCDGWCRRQMRQEDHQERIESAIRLLNGQFKEELQELKRQMEEAAEELKFERAAELRDRARAIELLGKRQKVVAGSLADTDVVGYFRGEAKSCFVALHFLEGELAGKDMVLLENPMEEETEEAVASMVVQFYGGKPILPKQILLPCEIEGDAAIARMLSEQSGHRVYLVTPQRGAKVDLIRLAEKNAREEVERATTKEERCSKLLEVLAGMLGLSKPPMRIESYDISNTGAADIVASMVVFQNARPLKRDYRHFKLRDMDGPDDYAAMEQVLQRRLRHYLEKDEKFGAVLPDVFFIDGGANHAAVAERVLRELGLSVPVFGMVKDDRHRTRALITAEGREIGIAQIPAVFALVGQIQEETHRFAIEFHRKQQGTHLKGSVLDNIEGVGPARRSALLKHFKSVKRIREASLAELCTVVPRPTAEKVYAYFDAEDNKAKGSEKA